MEPIDEATVTYWHRDIRELIRLEGDELTAVGLSEKQKIWILNQFWELCCTDTVPEAKVEEDTEEPSGTLDGEDKDAVATKAPDLEDIIRTVPLGYDEDKEEMFQEIVREVVKRKDDLDTKKKVNMFMHEMNRKYKETISTALIVYAYRKMLLAEEIEKSPTIEVQFKRKPGRGQHGVMVVTVLTTGYPINGEEVTTFSCKWNCKYCPTEPGQPKSYLRSEPAVLRANRNGFDPIFQVWDRLNAYIANNHVPDKIELLVLGGTWDSYPQEYRDGFIRDLYYACNTMFDKHKYKTPRKRLSLAEEKIINETTFSKIIGLTLETRPDMVCKKSLQQFIQYGVTRVQLGVQHFNDEILKIVDRRCPTRKTIRAIKLLKDCGFKVDIHLMPDLPGSNPESDKVDIVDRVNKDPDCQVDQIKYYPCETVDYSEILEWYRDGKYTPYGEGVNGDGSNPLEKLLIYAMANTPPWVRLNRIIRDIPDIYIKGGNPITNLRQCLERKMKEMGCVCMDIRSREVMGKKVDPSTAVLKHRTYEASEGTEHFLSYETPDESVIFGFLRLRFSEQAGAGVFPQLKSCAMIRELHVYGEVVAVGDRKEGKAQHYGFGRKLLEKAEQLAVENKFGKISVISGNGVKPYYRRWGYHDDAIRGYLIKPLA